MRILFHLFYPVFLSGTAFSGQYPPATVAMNLVQVSDHVYIYLSLEQEMMEE